MGDTADNGVTVSIPDLLAPFGWEAQWSWPHNHTSGEGVQVHVLIHTLSFIRACSGMHHSYASCLCSSQEQPIRHSLSARRVRWGEQALGAVPSSCSALSMGVGWPGARGHLGSAISLTGAACMPELPMATPCLLLFLHCILVQPHP